jgi:ribose transport system ATP-binding protein
MTDYALEMRHIHKSFNRNVVLRGVDFRVRRGEIHALIGENGAGKSTLMNLLGGVMQPDGGEIVVEDKLEVMSGPRVSKSLGISFIHQELNIVSDLRVFENMYLGSELVNRWGMLREEEMCRRCTKVLSSMGVEIDPYTPVRDLDASYKQIVEIARCLLEDAKILIMDEPTSSLTDHEIHILLTLMKSLKSQGVSIIYISHKLREIMEVCDSYTVLRDGALAGTGPLAGMDEEKLTGLMVGKSLDDWTYEKPEIGLRSVLTASKLSSGKAFRDIGFTLREGEILGFCGLSGDGRTELFECIFGYRRASSGSVYVQGEKKMIRHPSQAFAAGIGFVPKNRKENAIIKDMSVLHNMTLTSLSGFSRAGILDEKAERKRFYQYKDRLNIKVFDPDDRIVTLSGGNQQKVVLAKWLEADSDIIILDNPTQGIDVGAKSEIYQLIMQLRMEGKSIIVLSSEVKEILKLCDRVIVMFQGEITADISREHADEETIMLYATGAKREEAAV